MTSRIVPTSIPTRDVLETLSEDEILSVIDSFAQRGTVQLGVSFWMDELSRHRSETLLRRIGAATEANALQVERMAEAALQGAAQNTEMVRLNRSMHRLAIANVVLAALAVLAAVVAIVA